MAAPDPPPNLRVAESDAKDCGNCEYYTDVAVGHCSKYSNLPVNAGWLCDSWEADTDKSGPDADDKPVPREQQAKTLSDARVKVREHFRRARAQAAAKP